MVSKPTSDQKEVAEDEEEGGCLATSTPVLGLEGHASDGTGSPAWRWSPRQVGIRKTELQDGGLRVGKRTSAALWASHSVMGTWGAWRSSWRVLLGVEGGLLHVEVGRRLGIC